MAISKIPAAGLADIAAAIEGASDSNKFSDADHSKLNAVEASATADQTNAEIKAAVEAATDSNTFTDADHSKLNAIEASATADQTNAEIRTAVEAASDSNVFTDADHSKLNALDSSAYATAAQGTLATNALPKAGGTMTGNIAHAGNFTLDVGGTIILDGDEAGNNIHLKDSGTHYGSLLRNNSDFEIHAIAQDKDIVFKGNDGGSAIEAMRIDMSAAGNVGIGLTAPVNKLHVGGADGESYIKFTSDATGHTSGDGARIGLNSDDLRIINAESAGHMLFLTANTERMRIDSAGKVGIGIAPSDHTVSIKANDGIANVLELGTSDSQTKLNFSRQGNPTAYIRMVEDGSVGTGGLRFGVGLSHNPADALNIKSDGNVGIGTTAPAAKVDISNGGGVAHYQITQASGNTAKFGIVSGSDIEISGTSNNDILFKRAGSEKLRITSSGLTFNGDTAAANALNDYEEGTWTPSISTTSGGSSMTYSGSTHGNYIKIGKYVQVYGMMQLTAKGNLQAGSLFVQGFPFTMANIAGEGQGGQITEFGGFSVNFNTPILAFTSSGRMLVRHTTTNGGSTYTNVTGNDVGNGSYFRFNATYTTTS